MLSTWRDKEGKGGGRRVTKMLQINSGSALKMSSGFVIPLRYRARALNPGIWRRDGKGDKLGE
jgi:hypothetical protein